MSVLAEIPCLKLPFMVTDNEYNDNTDYNDDSSSTTTTNNNHNTYNFNYRGSPEEHGCTARATAQTAANDASSRSHAVFIVVVEQSETLVDDDAPGGWSRDGETERAAGPPDLPGARRSERTQIHEPHV